MRYRPSVTHQPQPYGALGYRPNTPYKTKQHGLIDSLKEQLDRLIDPGSFRLGQQLYDRALRHVGE